MVLMQYWTIAAHAITNSLVIIIIIIFIIIM